jgi:Cu(I)/Ag(I) efflux system membrane fusion protein
MKRNIFKTILISSLVFLTHFSGKASTDTSTFKVSGNCEMCKETIEAALDVKGVKHANWSIETGLITVVFNPEKISLDKIHELISKAGYETDKLPANESAYRELHKCCRYTKKLHQ